MGSEAKWVGSCHYAIFMCSLQFLCLKNSTPPITLEKYYTNSELSYKWHRKHADHDFPTLHIPVETHFRLTETSAFLQEATSGLRPGKSLEAECSTLGAQYARVQAQVRKGGAKDTALAALAGDPDLILSTHMIANSSSSGSDAFS